MCKVGDIILVKNYVDNGKTLGQHSFIVLNDESGKIQGLDYDLICNVMSSFKSEEHKEKKLRYPGNFPVTYNDTNIFNGGNQKEGYIKADQFYYFTKEKLDYMVIGTINPDVFNALIKCINELDHIHEVVGNL